MTRYVIGPDVALELARLRPQLPARHRLLAPTLLRSQVLAALYQQVRAGTLAQAEADQRLDAIRALPLPLPLRLLGDRVLQRQAWRIAQELDWPDTFVAEFLALTRLQADALVLRDAQLAAVARRIVPVAPFDELLAS